VTRRPVVVLASLAMLTSCGYHVAGKSDLLPKEIHTIAIPAFGNATNRVIFSNAVPSALTREFIRRSRYRIVADPNEADASLTGTVLQYNSYPILIDPVSGRPSGVQMIAVLQVRLTQRDGKVLPQPWKIHELEIHHQRLLLFCHSYYIFSFH
jgi:outer membrane lipopolysaccharide assembly protein LptE/RlpB